MVQVQIRGIDVNFPFQPYGCQVSYMEKVIQCLQEEKNGILESPTGTGKTLCLLCATLAWRETYVAQLQLQQRLSSDQNGSNYVQTLGDELKEAAYGQSWGASNDDKASFFEAPRILYASRTHSQLSQAVQELKNTIYRPKVSIIGSREQLCVNNDVLKQETNSAKVHMCRAKVQARTCHFYNNLEGNKANKDFTQGILDIEDLVELGKKHRACPYYMARELKTGADIIFMPYNYLLDAKSRKANSLDISGSIILFDEAHNVEKTCEESASFDLTSFDIASCIEDISQCIELIECREHNELAVEEGAADVDVNKEDLAHLKSLFIELEKLIDGLELPKSGEGLTRPGSFMFELLSKLNISYSTKDQVLEVLEKCNSVLVGDTRKFKGKHFALQKFSDALQVVFSKDPSNAHASADSSKLFKVHIQLEADSKKKKKNLDVWTAGSNISKQAAMLATQLNDLVISKHIEAKAVVQLDKYICNIIQETRKVLIVLEVSVLKTADEVVGKIGDPKPINAESKSEQQQHQNLQQNVSGPVQRNMSDDFHQNQPQRGSAGQVLAQQQSRAGAMGGSKLGAPVRTGGLASATYGSNQQVSRGGNNPKPVYPISSLTPYQNRWTIRVRVTSKSNIRTWSNSKGEGRVFNVDFVDESGEIRATGFNDIIDKFYELLEVNKVYYISKCSLKTANKQYSSIKNDYEMYINNDTIIELCNDPCDLPTIQYNFVSIGDLSNCSGNDIVDILGVVITMDEVSQITTKATNRQISKRDITLLDRSEKSVRATLWGDYAEKFEEHVGKNPVLALKGVKVSEYGGRSLSVLNSTNIMVNPLDLKEAHSLRGWYMNVGKDTAIESMSGQRSDGSLGSGSYKTLLQVKSEQLGMGDKPDYFTAKATAVFFKKDNCLYKACPSPECNKKVIEEGDGTYRCEKCNKTYPDFKYRLILSANLADFSGNQWVTCFQESAEAILNTSASQIGQMKDSNDEQAFDQIFSEANFKTYNFRIRAKMETYNDETRLKCSCMGATPLDFQKECRRLIEEIKKLQAL